MNTAPTLAELGIDEVARQLRALGVERGGVLLVHTSFRAVRPIENGPRGLIEALRAAVGPWGTLVMPAWTGDDHAPFDAATTPAARDLGVVADTFWRLHGVARSDHPFALAAAGPLARSITGGPMTFPPYTPDSPLGRVCQLDGQVLLLGVGHDADTMLHLAEFIARVPYRVARHATVSRDGRPLRIDYEEIDHCCERFALADAWLRQRGLQAEGRVGHAHARLARARHIVAVASERLAAEPCLFLHPRDAGCVECEAAWDSMSV